MSLANYVANFFVNNNNNQIFSVTGGFAMFLNDEFGNNEKLNVIYQHHEQACGYSAIGFTKVSCKPSIVCTTAGCGITNTISCINSAWQDSLPIIFISGQSKKLHVEEKFQVRLRKMLQQSSESLLAEYLEKIAFGNL